MASLSNVINVALLPEGQAVARDNMNVVTIFTSQQDGPINSANRYALYRDANSVATDFGSNSDAAQYADVFFGTSPNATNFGGVLVMGYWRGASETVAASAATLTGAQISEATVVPLLQAISDGSFDIDVDGTTVNVTALDLRTVTSLTEAATALSAAITGATVTYSDQRLIVTSDTTGVLSTLTVTTDPGTGTYLGTILALGAGTGAVLVQGAASSVLSAETKSEAVAALKSLVNYKGYCFIDAVSDADRKLLAVWGQANGVLGYEVFSSATNLEIDPTNPVWDIKLSSLTYYRMLYSAAGNRQLAASYMARAHCVNFNAERSALTMHLKTLNVAAEDYDETVIAKAKAVGLDVYVPFSGGVGAVLCSPANDFVDNGYNLLAFVNAVQVDMFNLLKLTSTKIPQTDEGVAAIVDQAEKTTRGFVRAGVFAPGTWSSPDYFGVREVFERSITANGFYWLAGALADQPQADRQARKSPVLQGAVKNAGAIHEVDIIINFNV